MCVETTNTAEIVGTPHYYFEQARSITVTAAATIDSYM
jgi:hypothetical protein